MQRWKTAREGPTLSSKLLQRKKQEGSQPSKGTSPANPSTKRKQPEKTDRLPKKPKTVLESVVELKVKTKKTITPLGQGRGKGLMMGPAPVTEKPPILLHEDSKYALEQFSSIITTDDYEDLSNHTTEAIGEMRLFSIAQVTMSVPFPIFFPSTFLVTNPFLFLGDETVDGLLPKPRDGTSLYQGKGKRDGG